MSQNRESKSKGKPVAVVIGATSKWQSNGRNTLLAHGKTLKESDFPVAVRWGVGGAIAQKFAQEGFLVVLTTRSKANAASLAQAIERQNGECLIVELDLASQASIATAFATIRRDAGDPEVVVYNAGYLEGRELTPTQLLALAETRPVADQGQDLGKPQLGAGSAIVDGRHVVTPKRGTGRGTRKKKPACLSLPPSAGARHTARPWGRCCK